MSSINISSWQPLALVSIVLVAMLVAKVLRSRFRSGLRQLPGPYLAAYSPLWNITNAASGDSHESFRKLHEKYGQVVRTGPNHVAIADPAMVSVIYGTNNNFLKSDFYVTFGTPYQKTMMQSMFSTREKAQHKSLRQAVSNKYSMTSLRNFELQIDSCNAKFIEILREFATTNEVVDFGTWLQWYAFDVIGAITFSTPFGFMDEREDIQNIIHGLEGGFWYGSIVGQVPGAHRWLLGNQQLINLFSTVLDTVNPVPKIVKMVEAAITHYDQDTLCNATRTDFLSLFRKEAKKSPDRMPHRDLMNHLMNNLLAGSDTTAISLRAIFYYLVQNPRCLEILRQEIDTAEREKRISEHITLAESLQMPYLQACMKEAMRLHPGIGFPLERVVPLEGLAVGNVLLPAGTIVGMHAWVVHHDKTIFGEDADDFRPERWLAQDVDNIRRMDKCFLSRNQFGAGTRSCIGKNISMMEMGKLVPQVLRNFDIEWASKDAKWQVKTFWLAKQTGVHMRFQTRNKGQVNM
ncbi:Pisatin demethylase [Lachnellula subtilissima]|uniref:Pisatin demethylase n=1 Tax=Lachnellula subtilissima TaxID=602034 RepID=A0A8H8UGE4_9HELO|nr:Pisatin demethylase [Lachnellula subtilissima]